MKEVLLAAVCTAAVAVGSASAYAQDTSAGQSGSKDKKAETELQEIIVTATRRTEKLQDVPISITAFSQEQLTREGIVGYEGLAQSTPGVVMNRPTQNFNNFTSRGIATNGYNANLQSTVAIYVDELPISANGNSTILDPSLFDVERVEFLRGPQGTLFGSGSLAGAMRIITKKPQLDEFDMSAMVDFGLTGSDSLRQRYNLMLNTPLVEDKLGFRFVGFYRNEDGYLDNVFTGEHNSNKLIDWGGRASMLWQPTDAMSLRLTVGHEDSDPKDSSLTNPALGRNKRNSDFPDLFVANLDTYNATIDYQFDGAHFTSSTTYSEFDQLFFVDLGNTFAFTTPFRLDATAYDNIFVEEARLVSDPGNKIDWVLGTFYFYKRRDVDYVYRSSQEFLDARGLTGLEDDAYQVFGAHSIGHEFAGFGELTYHISDQLWLTGGLRYGSVDVQSETEEGGFNSNYLALALGGFSNVPLTIVPVAAAVGDKAKKSSASYKVSLSYQPSDEITTYATISTGFRAPIVNARGGLSSVVDPTDLVIPYGADSDKLTNYEVGLKGRWYGGRLTANLAAYLIDWKDIQVQANRTSDQVQFATNIGSARSKGFEFEITAVPATGLDISINGSLNDSKVTDLTDEEAAISGAVEGAQLASPHFQGSVNVKYSFDVTDEMQGFVAANMYHISSFPGMFQYVPGRPGVENPNYDRTDKYNNVKAQVGFYQGRWMVVAYAENLFDDHSVTYVHPESFLASRYGTLRPRTVGVRVSFDY
ncbi:MAG: TonB-dependent receptor [Alphaproteobacteria bacterium]|nr:MAG: TonB-dependent receptor [Alphaproteobacteria bacterium]